MPDERIEPSDIYDASLVRDPDKANLGDLTVLNDLLRASVGEALTAKGKDAIERVARKTASVLLGKDASHAPVAAWNEPGCIDEVVGEWTGHGDSPDDTMTNAVLKLYSEIMDVAAYSEQPGVTSDLWKDQVTGVINRYALMFIGVAPHTQLQM